MLADRLLVVVADDDLRSRLTRALEEDGHAVQGAGDAVTALARLDAAPDALIIADDLPDAGGRDLRQAMLARGVQAPALFLVRRDAPADVGPPGGGRDELLIAPIDVDEALARVRTLLRRDRAATPVPPGVLQLDPVLHAVRGEYGAVSLTPTEYRVLAALVERRGVIVRRGDLVGAAWPADAMVSDNSLHQYIARLRAKLDHVTRGASIVTTRGVGYRLD